MQSYKEDADNIMKPSITNRFREDLRNTLGRALESLQSRDFTREEIIRLSREIIRCSGRVISYIVSKDIERGIRELETCNHLVSRLLEIYNKEQDLVRGGLGLQSLVEYCEAVYLARASLDLNIECPSQIPPEAVVLGVLDMTGELRRIAINLIGEWDLESSRKIIDLMREIYNLLSPIDLPDAIAPGFRHKIDVLRRNIEDLETLYSDIRTRRDLIEALKNTKNSENT
ncbi:MAG: hypothetical protein QW366_02420 [Sulfolobales archaeon]